MRQGLLPFTALLLGSQTLSYAAETLPPFANGGKPAYRIEVGRDASDSELLAVAELSVYLARVSGVADKSRFGEYYDRAQPSAEGVDGRKDRVIYVGLTDFAKANGLDGAAMQPEEWALKTVGTNLILTGGRPRGTLYAVYDFLENECGVRWFDRDTEVVPENPSLAIPPIDRRGKPHMWFRYPGPNDGALPEVNAAAQRRFEARNRCPGRMIPFLPRFLHNEDPWSYNPDLGTPIWNLSQYRSDGGEPFHSFCHTYYTYVPPREFYAKHPEYYGFTRDNAPKEPPSANGGKLCLTNPEVRKIAAERLKETIRRDRAKERSFGVQPPRFYDLSMMDSSSAGTMECPCPTCRDFVKQHGAESDLLIEFVNAVAAAVEEDYPGVTITTLAYYYNMVPPRQVKPRGNVLVEWCNWGGAPDAGPFLDRALTHPENAWRLKTLHGWRDMGARLGMWEYMNLAINWAPYASVPMTIAPYSIGNLQVYNGVAAEWLFDCSAGAKAAPWEFESFVSLRRWSTLRLMLDPACDVPTMLDTFFSGYFGPAGGKLREFYDLLVECQERPREKRQLARRSATLDYLTPEFYQTVQRLFDEAVAACATDADALLRVRQERLRVDLSLLELWGDLERQLPDGETLPFDRTGVIDRFEANGKAVIEGRSWSDKALFAKNLAKEVTYRRAPRLPDVAATLDIREVCDITPRYFVLWHLSYPKSNKKLDDPAAASGEAMVFEGTPGWPSQPVEFKLAGLTHTVTPSDFPRDGQYHLYKLGRTRLLGNDQNLKIVTNGKVAGGLDLNTRINRLDSAAEWHVAVSAKLGGPSFAPGSGDTDAIWIERIILVRAVPGFTRPTEERQALSEDQSTTLLAARAATKLCDLPVTWRFRPDPKDEGEAAKWFGVEPDDVWADIRTDQSWTTQTPGKDYHGTAWYSVTFTPPAVEQKAASLLAVELPRFFLLFGAVDGECWIWLDGKPVGSQFVPPQVMWDKPFAIDLGRETVKPGQPQRLVVKVKKDSAAAGIWKPVELRVGK